MTGLLIDSTNHFIGEKDRKVKQHRHRYGVLVVIACQYDTVPASSG